MRGQGQRCQHYLLVQSFENLWESEAPAELAMLWLGGSLAPQVTNWSGKLKKKCSQRDLSPPTYGSVG